MANSNNSHGCPSIPLDEWVYPVRTPEAVGRQFCRRPNVPVFLDRRDEPIHPVFNIPEVGRLVIAYVNWLFAKPPAELLNVGGCNMIKGPEEKLAE